jgi:cyclic lactone autoinducer peptide
MFILETITIVGFLTLLFTQKLSWKVLLNFILIGGSIYFVESYNLNNFLEAGIICILATLIWSLLSSTNSFFDILRKTALTNFICIIGMIVIQNAWIPFVCYITGKDLSYVLSNIYMFGLPCRAIEYIILIFIYIFKVKPTIVSGALTTIAKTTVKSASIWWVYQKKEPKILKLEGNNDKNMY